jgi:hypothetical protein
VKLVKRNLKLMINPVIELIKRQKDLIIVLIVLLNVRGNIQINQGKQNEYKRIY